MDKGAGLIFPQHKKAYSSSEVGGKAAHLLELTGKGYHVPDFVVIPQAAFLSLFEGLDQHPDISLVIASIKIPDTWLNEILNYLGPGSVFAVRSSAGLEDGSKHSFAGMFTSRLDVNAGKLEEAIKEVWLSAFDERVKTYCRTYHLPPVQALSVIVQKYIRADVSGVAFTMNPLTGDRQQVVINALYGMGEALVSGELNADQYLVKQNRTEQAVVPKPFRLVAGEKVPVAAELVDKPALSEAGINEVCRLLASLRKDYIHHLDIEFCLAEGKIHLLQVRPVTTGSRVPDPAGTFRVWDNSNIIESYPGLTSPLTFSFIVKMYEAVYRQFSLLMGVSPVVIEQNRGTYENMLGLIKGRVYYNLLSWYKTLALLPGYKLNAAFMEKMMGVKERFELEQSSSKGIKDYLQAVAAVLKILNNHRTLDKQRIRFLDHLEKTLGHYKAIKWEERSAEELMQDYLEFEQTLVKKWKAPLVNDFFAMIYFGVLQKMITSYGIDDTGTLHNELVAASKDIISTEPITLSQAIADNIKKDPLLKDMFLSADEHTIWHELQQGKFEEVKTEINSYLDKWGARCVGELKLETVTYRQAPWLYIRMLKHYVAQEANTHQTIQTSGNREQAEKKAMAALKGKPLKKRLFRYVLKKTRYLVSNRENLRFERTRGFDMVRTIFVEIGKRFAAEGLLDSAEDIFYLRQQEIADYINGTSVHADLKMLVSFRKAEYESFSRETPAERIRTWGMVYAGNDLNPPSAGSIPDGDLQGVPCCAGIVKAKVQVLASPNDAENIQGCILVTSSTDPGWVTLFPSVAGILVERGSLLSHSAIVAREMGIPCIVGITGLLAKLRSGDTVEMDGKTGIIRILE